MLVEPSKHLFIKDHRLVKMASEDPKKISLKITNNIKLSGFFSKLRGLNYSSYQRFEAIFQ